MKSPANAKSMSSLSLMAIMRDDPAFGQRLQKKVQEVKKNKEDLLSAADDYGKKYEEEVIKGTELRAKLLTEGSSRGLSETQIMSDYGRFVPTVYTPILNMLYFLLRESEPQDSRHYQRRDVINEVLLKTKQINHDDDDDEEHDLSPEEFQSLLDEKLKDLYEETCASEQRKEANIQFSKEDREKAALKNAPEMVEFLYGNITLDMFNKIKKLKALSKSPNEQEAFQAYRKAVDLCKQYNLDFDRIPCYVKGQDE